MRSSRLSQNTGFGLPAKCILLTVLALVATTASAAGDRLLATGGAVSLEATAGGGITPWSVLAGYGTDDQFGCAAGVTGVETGDYSLGAIGLACSWHNRLEVSVGRQSLDLDGLRPLLSLPRNQMLRQRYLGLKLRLAGNVVYSPWGQVSAGVIYKDAEDEGLVRAAGANATSGTDWYLSAGKLFLEGPLRRMAYVNATLRWTNANQGGLLGFGGDLRNSRRAQLEIAGAIFASRELAVGAEYRQKPDNLGFADEDDWADLFIAWFPSKHMSVVAAWAWLGDIGTLPDQEGPYLSVAGSF